MKLAKLYEPGEYEPRIYQMWETSGAFRPGLGDEKFSLVLPPPNANGNLHLGHGLVNAVEDILARYNRLQGKSVAYIPGADHAGFETWVVFEKYLTAQGKSRFDYSREQLYTMVWDFVAKNRGNMEVQLRELGASLDWDSLTFTLDEKVIKTTYQTFKKLWDDKLVYRGERIVNFCTNHQTSFADIEIKHVSEKSKLWEIVYQLSDREGEIVVATTRPETLLGDTAVAVNPNDKRYKQFIGKYVTLPITGREVPIVADESIDMSFGTGAVKVTPAHDLSDFEIGGRNKLPIIQVVGFDGLMTNECPENYRGLTVHEARKKIVEDLESTNALKSAKDYTHMVGHCYKCDTVIEPLIKDQWFINVQPLAAKAIASIENGDVTFTPKNKGKVLVAYLKNLRDWNISRQIPWGIPIPAFQSSHDPSEWIFDERVEKSFITKDGIKYLREDDTFDTWFSSGQWPFITTDYLEKGELSKFYPLSVMETAGEILFAWVARMLMLGLYATNKVPFKHVYLHGLVLDDVGQKMSKSKGNVINPQDLIKEYGSDALRAGLIANRAPGVNQAFSVATVLAGRNFCNKLWNVARYIQDKLGENPLIDNPTPLSAADHWIVSRMDQASIKVAKYLGDYRFAEAYETVYHTIWDDLADWYIESSKTSLNQSILAYALQTSLQLAHPFVPFVTETIWQTLPWQKGLLIKSSWPKSAPFNKSMVKQFDQLKSLITEVRFVSAQLGHNKQTLIHQSDILIDQNNELIKYLGRLKDIKSVEKGSGLRLAIAKHEAWLDIDNATLLSHTKKLRDRLSEVEDSIKKLEARLSNKSYVKNAPAKVVQQTKTALTQQHTILERLRRELQIIAE